MGQLNFVLTVNVIRQIAIKRQTTHLSAMSTPSVCTDIFNRRVKLPLLLISNV